MVHLGPKKPPARKGSMADILTRFFQCRLQNKLGLQDILDFFCNPTSKNQKAMSL